jgi:cytochrome c553
MARSKPKEYWSGLMTGVRLPLLRSMALFAMLFSTPGFAEERQSNAPSKAEVEAKLAYCKTCHGLSGQGFRGASPMPRLAGQQPEYVQNQLQAFIERQRTSPVMFNVAHVLKPGMLEALAEGFKDLNPKPLGGEPKELIGAGKKIYEEGVPDAKIAPCATCHGPEAKGAGGFPRLAGQLQDYTSRKLTSWDKERGQDRAKPDASPIMEPIAHGLTAQQIAEVSAYLGSLE